MRNRKGIAMISTDRMCTYEDDDLGILTIEYSMLEWEESHPYGNTYVKEMMAEAIIRSVTSEDGKEVTMTPELGDKVYKVAWANFYGN